MNDRALLCFIAAMIIFLTGVASARVFFDLRPAAPEPQTWAAPVYALDSTAYTPTGQPTAILEEATPGWTIAVSSDHMGLLGRRVYVTGLGLRRVNDLMAEGITDCIDVCMPDERSAVKYGRQPVTLVVLPE